MSNPTTPFSWQMPTATDLVTDLPADFEVFGQAVATSMADLLGGTSGQVLAKNSNTDMDFVWVTSDDANAIQNTIVDAKGDLIAASASDTPARLAVGTNEHRLVAASGETTGLKYVADTTNYAIAAKADLLVGTAADTLAALTVGTNGQVLTADSTVSPTGLKWATPSGSSGPAFSVFRATTSQSFTTGVNTKVQWNGETFDTDNCFDSTTNYRFTPTTAGYYQINCSIYFDNATANYTLVSLDRNGVQYRRFFSDSVGASGASAGGSAIVYLNGSSDYLEIFVESNATSPKVYFNAYNSYFDGVWIRS
jgi:hypothetical protein